MQYTSQNKKITIKEIRSEIAFYKMMLKDDLKRKKEIQEQISCNRKEIHSYEQMLIRRKK